MALRAPLPYGSRDKAGLRLFHIQTTHIIYLYLFSSQFSSVVLSPYLSRAPWQAIGQRSTGGATSVNFRRPLLRKMFVTAMWGEQRMPYMGDRLVCQTARRCTMHVGYK
jgi:hypothetical protein